jgi:hypothetical protein
MILCPRQKIAKMPIFKDKDAILHIAMRQKTPFLASLRPYLGQIIPFYQKHQI